MNKEIYWKIRKIILSAIFHIKKLLYKCILVVDEEQEYIGFRKVIFGNVFLGMLYPLLIICITTYFDKLIIKACKLSAIDNNVFIPIVIGGIGVAGVVLGLYCANITSIYSTRYIDAPNDIAIAFQYDSQTRKCIFSIVRYIIFGFIIIGKQLITNDINLVTEIVFVFWSILVIVSFSITGNRIYQLSDVYNISADAKRILYRIVSKRLQQQIFNKDENFLSYFLTTTEKKIETLKLIQKYSLTQKSSIKSDNSSTIIFMRDNLSILNCYWSNKYRISKKSSWFRCEPKYQKWYLSSDYESSIALETGTPLLAKNENNYWWLEEELFSLNKTCMIAFFDENDYSSLNVYLELLEGQCYKAISSNELSVYFKHIEWIRKEIENKIELNDFDNESQKLFANVVDHISLLYLNIILNINKYYQDFDFDEKFKIIMHEIESGKDIEDCNNLKRLENTDYFNKIITEIKIEGRRITPYRFIRQEVAHEEYIRMNITIDIAREGCERIFEIGKKLLDKKRYFEACITLTRFYEYESKINSLLSTIKKQSKTLVGSHISKRKEWPNSKITKFEEVVTKFKLEIPKLLQESATQFAFENWDKREDYPDFLGECFNRICEDSIDAITLNNMDQFKVDFCNLTKIMFLYQEYIRTDFVKNKDLYTVQQSFYIFTSPIVEWAQIGGLAILWGEFNENTQWQEVVKESAEILSANTKESVILAKVVIEYIKERDNFIFGIRNRDIIETRWKQKLENAIRKNDLCKSEYERYDMVLKNPSKLLKSFCPNFEQYGFINDPSEVFWILCANPYLSEQDKYKSRYCWEKINHEEYN